MEGVGCSGKLICLPMRIMIVEIVQRDGCALLHRSPSRSRLLLLLLYLFCNFISLYTLGEWHDDSAVAGEA